MLGYPDGTPETAAAATAASERHPGLAHVIGGCVVGWSDPVPRVVYQALVVKVAEYIEGLGDDT